MIYKAIILIASVFMIYEFTKPKITLAYHNKLIADSCNNSVIGFTGEAVCLDHQPYLKLNGV